MAAERRLRALSEFKQVSDVIITNRMADGGYLINRGAARNTYYCINEKIPRQS